MASHRTNRVRAGLGGFDAWLRDRNEDLAEGTANVEAAGRRFYGEARKTLTRAESEARKLLDGVSGPSTGAPSKGAAAAPRASGSSTRGAKRNPRSWDQQILDNADRLIADAKREVRTRTARVNADPTVRELGGDAALGVGNLVGLVTGAIQAAEDMKDGAVFLGRLADPTESYRRPAGEAAWDDVAAAGGAALDYAKKAIADPRGAASATLAAGRKTARELDPNAGLPAATLAGEMQRKFEMGKKQSEIGAEAASWVAGAGELKAAARVGRLSRAARVAKYAEQGFSPAKAEYLAQLYKGKGHHSILTERTRLPEFLGGGPPPRWMLDNPFNVLKPAGVSRGEMYELHSQVDPFFYGAGLPRRVGGGGWSSKRLGLGKYDGLQRIYYGTPGPTKAVIGGGAVAGGAYLNEALGEER